jgi:hypothetical protein
VDGRVQRLEERAASRKRSLLDPVPALVAAVELVDELALPGLEDERLADRRPLLVAQVLGEERGDHEFPARDQAVAASDDSLMKSGRPLDIECSRTPLGLGRRSW